MSDQSEVLPFLLSRLHPDLLKNDWFVTLQNSRVGIRSGVVSLLQPLATLVPIWIAVLTVYVVSAVACISGVFRLSWMALRDPIHAMVSTVAVLVLTPYWNLGGNELMNRMLTPSMLAWGLALWAIVFWCRKKSVVPGLLLGCAAFAQPLVALQMALLLSVSWIYLYVRTREPGSVKGFGAFLLVFGLLSLPILGPLVLEQIAGPASDEAFYIIAAFRNPHHYYPDAFPVSSYLKFFGIAIFGGVALWHNRGHIHSDFLVIAKALLVSIGVLLLIAFAGSTLLQQPTLIKLQLFKLTVLAKTILLIGIVAEALRFFPDRFLVQLRRVVDGRGATLAAAVLVVLTVTASIAVPSVKERTLRAIARANSAEGRMLEWIKNNTDKDGLFAVPPSLSGFRFRSERAIFIDFKAFPFQDEPMLEWYRRLQLEAPIPAPRRGGVPALDQLDASYRNMSAETLGRLVKDEKVRFLLHLEETPPSRVVPGLSLLHREGNWRLYEYLLNTDP